MLSNLVEDGKQNTQDHQPECRGYIADKYRQNQINRHPVYVQLTDPLNLTEKSRSLIVRLRAPNQEAINVPLAEYVFVLASIEPNGFTVLLEVIVNAHSNNPTQPLVERHVAGPRPEAG